MKTKKLLKCLLLLPVLFSSCSRDEYDINLPSTMEEDLSPQGELFMQIIKSSNNWGYEWEKIKEVGIPMPNDVIYTYISRNGLYAVIPVLSKEDKTIEAIVFYSLKQEANRVKLNNSPEIIQKDFMKDDIKSKIGIQTQLFVDWEKKGYKIITQSNSSDKETIPNKTKTYSNNIFPFDFAITFASQNALEYSSTVNDIKNTLERVPSLLPRGNIYHLDWDTNCVILTVDGDKPEDAAKAYFESAYQSLMMMPNIISVKFIYYWNPDYYEGGGGGGSGSGSGEKPIDRTPKELADAKSKFVPFELEGDCMKICKAVMDKFGLDKKYGDSQHVFQLLVNTTDNILQYPSDNTTFNNARDCIDIHLNNNRPLIVGVNILDHAVTGNIDGTDHFIVIIGRGSDAQGSYYTYMETGTSQLALGYNTTENRLYHNPETNGLTDINNFQGFRYDVTNVRPNDGKTYNTTGLKSNL